MIQRCSLVVTQNATATAHMLHFWFPTECDDVWRPRGSKY